MLSIIITIFVCFIILLFFTGKTVVFRKIVKNGQPEEETIEAEKDAAKAETKAPQKSESVKVEVEKKEKPKIKPAIKPKVFIYILYIHLHNQIVLIFTII